MFLGGICKCSLIDYPGRMSCVLFAKGCNFECPFCHNPELVRDGSNTNTDLKSRALDDFLESRRDFLDGIVISGGEPTLQEGIFSLCRRLKAMNYRVKLDTNGSRPEVIERLLDEQLLDYIAMDIKADPDKYPLSIVAGLAPDTIPRSIKLIMESDIDSEFRTTCVRPFIDKDIVKKIARSIKGSALYALQRFNNTEVLRPGLFRCTSSRFSPEELEELQSIAEPWVGKCIVR